MAADWKLMSAAVWPTVKPFVNGGVSGMLATCVIQGTLLPSFSFSSLSSFLTSNANAFSFIAASTLMLLFTFFFLYDLLSVLLGYLNGHLCILSVGSRVQRNITFLISLSSFAISLSNNLFISFSRVHSLSLFKNNC